MSSFVGTYAKHSVHLRKYPQISGLASPKLWSDIYVHKSLFHFHPNLYFWLQWLCSSWRLDRFRDVLLWSSLLSSFFLFSMQLLSGSFPTGSLLLPNWTMLVTMAWTAVSLFGTMEDFLSRRAVCPQHGFFTALSISLSKMELPSPAKLSLETCSTVV